MLSMSASVNLLIAALVQNYGAARLSLSYHPPAQHLGLHAVHGLARHGPHWHSPITRTPWRVARPQMKPDSEVSDSGWQPNLPDDWRADPRLVRQPDSPSAETDGILGMLDLDRFPSFRYDALRVLDLVYASRWPYNRFDSTSPPAEGTIDMIDVTLLLRAWIFEQQQSGDRPGENVNETASISWKIEEGLPARKEMQGLIAVGLIPNDPSSKYSSVMALGAFSRAKLKEDSMGSLLKMVEAEFGIKATLNIFGNDKQSVSVFNIKGIAEGTGSSEGSARVLLAKIGRWAKTEQRLVVLARDAVKLPNGRDLTDYYIRLGFQRVKRGDGLFDFVYSSDSSKPDLWSRTLVGLKVRG